MSDRDEMREVQHRLAMLEAEVRELRERVDGKRRKAAKRARTHAHNAYASALASGFKPTEDQIAAARKALARSTRRAK